MIKHAGLVAAVLLACIMSSVSAIPCFPDAEGFGTETPGGRGGRVIAVTNLNDSGPGSLRAACEAKGPRIVVFRVSGYIRLAKSLRITEPFITIAGQSAPGKGICLRDAVLQVETHDVVIRFIRVRVGPSLNEPIDRQNCIEVHGENAYNVVIDHCSFSWGLDENVGIVSKAHDCTFSYNIVSEALRKPFTATKIGEDRSHSMALILGNFPDRCSIHHNLLANCNSRMPRIQGGTHDFVNNVVYDWGFMAGMFSRNPSVNLIGNYYKPGPASKQIKPVVVQEDVGRIYVSGNFLLGQGLLEWKDITDADPALHQAVTAFPAPCITTTSATEAYRQVLSKAGCRLPAIDEVDKRVIRQAYLGFGVKIDRPEDVGGYPTLPITFAPKDSDSDGMPDSWEIDHRLNPLDPSDGPRDRDRDGYTNVEEYLNSLVSEWIAQPAKVIPYPVPDAVIDSPYSVVANGVSIPIEKAGDQKGAYYARFQFSGHVRVSATTRGDSTIQLKP
ncbi:MAG: pectate lyase family protein, partial [Armatimonadota bacterium]